MGGQRDGRPGGRSGKVEPMLMFGIFVIAAIAVTVPLVAVMLVSVASRQEDSAWTLGGPATGPTHAAARRIVGFHSPAVAHR